MTGEFGMTGKDLGRSWWEVYILSKCKTSYYRKKKGYDGYLKAVPVIV